MLNNDYLMHIFAVKLKYNHHRDPRHQQQQQQQHNKDFDSPTTDQAFLQVL